MAEILQNLNQTQNDLGSDTELLPVNIEEDEKKVVLLTTDLQHQFAFNNMFFLLYRQIVLQVKYRRNIFSAPKIKQKYFFPL